MPYRCCVPNCKGNYPNTPKVTVFGFPKDVGMKKKWLHAIKRKDFEPTATSKVCEVHFRPDDVVKKTSAFDEQSGKLLCYDLKKPKLVPEAIPYLLPNCPTYLSKEVTRKRPSRD